MYKYLTDLIENLAQSEPAQPLFTFLSPAHDAQTITAHQLYQDTNHSAEILREQGVQPGDLLLLVFDHGYQVVATFFGAMYAGATPSLLPYFSPDARSKIYLEQIKQLARVARAKAVVTRAEFQAHLNESFADPDCRVIALPPIPGGSAVVNPSPIHAPREVAYVQFSSGTTGSPKGVMLSHSALIHYLRITAEAFAFTADAGVVGWLPLYHDMGLVTQILQPLFSRQHSVLMSPADWLRQPELLFQTADRYRGATSWMPNFALRYCVRGVRDEQIAGVDLSSWRIVCGSELVHIEDLDAFANRFAKYGLKREALTVGYGLAEHVAGVTLTPPNKFPATEWISEKGLENSKAIVSEPYAKDSRPIVSCGYPKPTVALKIVNDAGQKLGERQVGEVLVTSPSLFAGYYLLPTESAEAMSDEWLRTGDLGYLAGGQLYICGRKKDLIIVGGRNIQPDHLETLAESVLGKQCRYAVAFGIPNAYLGTEIPVVVCEMRELPDAATRAQLEREIRDQARQAFQIFLTDVYLVEKGWISKTTSGKIKRSANRDKYLAEKKQFETTPAPIAPSSVTSTERQLVKIWERLFKQSPIHVHENFFDLGGDSLLAVQLALEIEEHFQFSVPASALLESPTIAGLARILEQHEHAVVWNTLVPIQPLTPQSRHPIFFCAHGLGGGVLGYKPLAQALGAAYPFYCLQARGLDGTGRIDTRIEEMAAHYVESIRALQARGPYHLGGYCFGGVVAYEMARQLTQTGEKVALVAIMEGDAPARGARRLAREWQYAFNFARSLPYWLRDYAQLERVEMVGRTRRMIRTLGKRLARLVGLKAEFGVQDVAENLASLPAQHQQIIASHIAALRDYSPTPCEARLVVFRRPRVMPRAPERDMGWGKLSTEPVNVEIIPGSYSAILKEPNVSVLAEKLKRYLVTL